MSKNISPIKGTKKIDDYHVKATSIKHGSSCNIDSAFNHALYRAKKLNKPFRVHQTVAGRSYTITEATESLPTNGTFYDVYKDGTIWN